MTKQLLIYNTVTPLTRRDHGELAYKPTSSFDFAHGLNAAPLVAAEFLAAAVDYAIVFSVGTEPPLPAALFGINPDQNLFVGKDGEWLGRYVPAFLRRWPFVFSTDAVGETYTLCIDETAPGLNRENRGERLFDGDGELTGYTQRIMDFLQEFQAQYERTKAFGQRLHDLGLLQTVEAQVTLSGEQSRTLTGFQIVNRDKLKSLPAETVEQMFRSDELDLIYLHLFSVRNLEQLREKALQAQKPGAD